MVTMMIGRFPPARPDENLYSLACEYKKEFRMRSDRDVALDLFGVNIAHDIVDFPSHLGFLESQIPAEFEISANYLIQKTTVFPYFSPFLNSQESQMLIDAMKGSISDARGVLTRVHKGANRSPRFLRLCVNCALEDKKGSGATYWRRIHQLPCAHVCHIHKTLLVSTFIGRGKTVYGNYVHADEVILPTIPSTRLSAACISVLSWISEQAQWLLDNPQPSLDKERLRQAYTSRMYESGFATASGVVRMNKLSLAMAKRYRDLPLNKYLRVGLTEEHVPNWLRRVISGCPIATENLLALHFFELSASELCGPMSKDIWFECGPWPCLNPICRDFKRDVIEGYDRKIANGRMVATFTCRCGYAYRRIGPDKNGEHRLAPYNCVENSVSDSLVLRVWPQKTQSLADIKEQLHISYAGLNRALVRLGLNPMDKARHGWPPSSTKKMRSSSTFENRRKKHRVGLLDWIGRHPGATRSDIRKGAATHVRWMQDHDLEWLMSKMPAKIKSPGGLIKAKRCIRSKMLEKDKLSAARVPSVASELHSQPGRPRRVTTARILTRLGFPNGLGQTGKHMKRTSAALRKHSEKFHECAIRRLKWFVEESKRTGERWNLSRLLLLSGIRRGRGGRKERSFEREPSVSRAVAFAKQELGI